MVGQQRAGQADAHPARLAHAAEGPVDHRPRPVGAGSRAAGVEALGVEVATRPAQVAGDEDQHVQQPVGQRALAAHVDAGGHVGAGRRRRGEVPRQRADGLGRDAGDGCHALGRPRCDEGPQRVDVAAVALQRRRIEAGAALDGVQQRGQQVDVGVGLDQQHLAGDGRGFDAARVDVDDARAARLCLFQPLHRVRHRHEGHVRDGRVLAEQHDQVGAVDVRQRVQGARAEHRFRPGELVGAVLRARAEVRAHPQLAPKPAEGLAEQAVERGRVAGVAGDRAWAVAVQRAAQPLRDVGQRLVPADGLEAARRHPLERDLQPVRVVVQVGAVQALVADEALADRVRAVGRQRHQPALVDGGDQAAGRLAHPAKRPLLLGHGNVYGAVSGQRGAMRIAPSSRMLWALR